MKFRVDGEWRVAPEWPTVGHGMTENNVLVVVVTGEWTTGCPVALAGCCLPNRSPDAPGC